MHHEEMQVVKPISAIAVVSVFAVAATMTTANSENAALVSDPVADLAKNTYLSKFIL